MTDLNLLTGKALAELAQVAGSAITKARKNDRLRFYQGTQKYDREDPLTRAFLENIPKERLNKPATIPVNGGVKDSDKDLVDSLTKSNLSQAKKQLEDAELTKQKRIEKEMKNAVRRSELIELEAIEKSIMTWFDRWLNSNKRGFNGSYDDFMRGAFKLFENEAAKGDERPHDITRSEHKQKWINDFESWADDGKQESMKRLQEIQISQGKK